MSSVAPYESLLLLRQVRCGGGHPADNYIAGDLRQRTDVSPSSLPVITVAAPIG